MRDALILGGGISGLTAAYLLRRQGLDVAVLEQAEQAGGPIASIRSEGYLHERGPNTLLLPDPWVEQLIADLGLRDRVLETNPDATKRYIVKNGRTIAVPASPIQAARTPLFSWRAKLSFLMEPFRPRLPDEAASQETVADFVVRRMGREFLDYAIDPFVSGVYAGDPRRLSLEQAFPTMRSFEREGGSLVRGAWRYRRRRKAEGSVYRKRSISFDTGLGLLPMTLAETLGERLRTRCRATAVESTDSGWQVFWESGGETGSDPARQLLVCLPAHAIKSIRWPQGLAQSLGSAPDLLYPAVHSLAIGFRRADIDHPLDGFGMLVPSREPQTILGALFSSSLFPRRAPDGHALLTVMLGGLRHPELAQSPMEDLLSIAMNDLRPLLGLRDDPHFANCASWPRAIPQYTADFAEWKALLRRLEGSHPALAFGGSAIDGVAMGAAIMSGKRLADRVLGDVS